jgi:poly-gamma-glutamate synthesis protein (capsule biosynthesis protein)
MRILFIALVAAMLAACADEDLLTAREARSLATPGATSPAARTAEGGVPLTPPAGDRAGTSWVAIAHPRQTVYELRLDDVRTILAGRVRDWSALGGPPAPIEALVPETDASEIEAALGLGQRALVARRLPATAIVEAVRHSPGAFALVRPAALTPDVLALVVEGHDPLGDPAATSPLRTAGEVAPFDPVLVVSPGEILPVRCANAALEASGDYGAMFEDVRPLLDRADVAIGGLDAPLTDVSPPTPCVSTFVLQGSARAAEAIAQAGIDLLFVNGNHMLDCWQPCPPYAGLRDTLARLHRLGVATAGAGENAGEARQPRVIEAGSGPRKTRIAFLAYDEIAPWNWATASTPGTAPLRREVVVEDVRAAKAVADVVIVGMSWGIEYTTDPTSTQRELAAAAVEAGATLIVGNHPHAVQAIERRSGPAGDALVVYAQGNYLFDQSWSVQTTQAVLLQAGFVDGRLIGYRLRPAVTRGYAGVRRGLYRPELVAPGSEEGRDILGRVWQAEDRLGW